jgi:hypothetical protein
MKNKFRQAVGGSTCCRSALATEIMLSLMGPGTTDKIWMPVSNTGRSHISSEVPAPAEIFNLPHKRATMRANSLWRGPVGRGAGSELGSSSTYIYIYIYMCVRESLECDLAAMLCCIGPIVQWTTDVCEDIAIWGALYSDLERSTMRLTDGNDSIIVVVPWMKPVVSDEIRVMLGRIFGFRRHDWFMWMIQISTFSLICKQNEE